MRELASRGVVLADTVLGRTGVYAITPIEVCHIRSPLRTALVRFEFLRILTN